MRKLALVLIFCASLLGLRPAPLTAQSIPGLLKPGIQAQASVSASADPLGRTTPRGAVVGFLQAAQDGNEKIAADYLQMSAARRQSQGPEIVDKLKVLMDSAFVGNLQQFIRPEGNPD